MPPETGPEPTEDDDKQPAPVASSPSAPAPVTSAPLLPAQSREDTDVGWGDYGDRDDDERLLRDRPPHWDNA